MGDQLQHRNVGRVPGGDRRRSAANVRKGKRKNRLPLVRGLLRPFKASAPAQAQFRGRRLRNADVAVRRRKGGKALRSLLAKRFPEFSEIRLEGLREEIGPGVSQQRRKKRPHLGERRKGKVSQKRKRLLFRGCGLGLLGAHARGIVLPLRDRDARGFIEPHAVVFETLDKTDAPEREDPEGVFVDVLRDRVDHCGEVLAGHGRVGASAAHAKGAPGSGKEFHADRERDLVELRRETSREEFRAEVGTPGNGCDEFLDVRFLRGRNADRDLVGKIGRARHGRVDFMVFGSPFERLDVSRVEVSPSAREAVGVVDLGEALEPLVSPPGFAEFRARRHATVLLQKKCPKY